MGMKFVLYMVAQLEKCKGADLHQCIARLPALAESRLGTNARRYFESVVSSKEGKRQLQEMCERLHQVSLYCCGANAMEGRNLQCVMCERHWTQLRQGAEMLCALCLQPNTIVRLARS